MMTTDELWNAHVTAMIGEYETAVDRALRNALRAKLGGLTAEDIRACLQEAWDAVQFIRTKEKEI